MRLRNQWLLLGVTLLLKLCTFFALCLALYVQPKSVHHEHKHVHTREQMPHRLTVDEAPTNDDLE
ncbi:hypothetical protein JST99_02130 [Candidatus Dependentiae bacterium]|nr:hypothetical protein [Candidatus Dependentiae bacterium]MCC7415358.1 hypothetical protein [Campylobacterota bacterium]